MDPERDSQRQTYQLCRLGFGILSLALLLACSQSILDLVARYAGPSFLVWLYELPLWRWVGIPIVWGSLLGTYLLWGRWNEPGWQRRVGLLIAMCVVDAVLWTLDHGDQLRLGDVGHHWLRHCLGWALGWAEFALLASLSGDVIAHLGVEAAREASKSTRALAATGASVWILLFVRCTNWARGWPLQGINRGAIDTDLLRLAVTMIWTITLIQVTALTIAATRETSSALAEMDREDRRDDLFRSRSETNAGVS
jgi:hypothetical protein